MSNSSSRSAVVGTRRLPLNETFGPRPAGFPRSQISREHLARKVERYDPVRLVDDLAAAQIGADAAQHAGVDGIHVMARRRQIESEAESFSSVPEQRARRRPIEAQSAAMARAMASIGNDERASSGVMSGHDRKTLSLSDQRFEPLPVQQIEVLPRRAAWMLLAELPLAHRRQAGAGICGAGEYIDAGIGRGIHCPRCLAPAGRKIARGIGGKFRAGRATHHADDQAPMTQPAPPRHDRRLRLHPIRMDPR